MASKTLYFMHAEPWRTVERRAGTAPGDFLWYLWEPARNYCRKKFYRKNGQDSGNAEDKK